jgi:hypothetical protein
MTKGPSVGSGFACEGAAAGDSGRGRVWFLPTAIVAAVAAMLLAAAWSLTSTLQPASAPRVAELGMPGGIVAVEPVKSSAAEQHAPPGRGTDNDSVAAGERRVSVDVAHSGVEPLEYHVGDFTTAEPGGSPRRPRRAILPSRSMPYGAHLAGTLIYDLPVTTSRVRPSYDGHRGTEVVTPVESRAPPADPTSAGTDQDFMRKLFNKT